MNQANSAFNMQLRASSCFRIPYYELFLVVIMCKTPVVCDFFYIFLYFLLVYMLEVRVSKRSLDTKTLFFCLYCSLMLP